MVSAVGSELIVPEVAVMLIRPPAFTNVTKPLLPVVLLTVATVVSDECPSHSICDVLRPGIGERANRHPGCRCRWCVLRSCALLPEKPILAAGK